MILSDIVARTDVGMVRDHNEDAHLVLPELSLLAVADGMGGLAHGELASATAVNTLRAARDSIRQVLASASAQPDAESRQQLAQTLELLTNLCNTQIQRTLGPGVSGSTLVVAFAVDGFLMVCNTGDSRAYLYRGGDLRRITEDHTVAAAQLRAGMITQEEHDESPYQHMLYQALGTQSEVDPDLLVEPLAEGDVVLLCSDGLTGPLSEDDIADILSESADLDEAARRLITAANEAGGPDNITLVLGRCAEGRPAAEVEQLHAALASSGPLSDLSEYDLRTLLLYLEFERNPEGPLDPADGARVILSGALEQGDRTLSPGEVFGLAPMADPALSEPDATVTAAGVSARLSQEAYEKLEKRRSLVAARLLKGLFRELARRAYAR
jgi:serine/threonine protein phosphatase PrpC